VTASKIRDAGYRIGQHIRVEDRPQYEHPGYERTTVDAHKILSLCTTDLSDEELDRLLLNLPQLVNTTQNRGRLSQGLIADLTGLDPTLYKNRDGLALDQSYPSCLTNLNEENRYRLWKKGHDPEEIKKRKQAEAALVKANKILANQKKKEDAAAAREALEEAKKATSAALVIRRSHMTKAQVTADKKEVAAATRAAAAVAKEAKTREQAAKNKKVAALLKRAAEVVSGDRVLLESDDEEDADGEDNEEGSSAQESDDDAADEGEEMDVED
jgi:hypothetical protein